MSTNSGKSSNGAVFRPILSRTPRPARSFVKNAMIRRVPKTVATLCNPDRDFCNPTAGG
jgi:hypothetical protein